MRSLTATLCVMVGLSAPAHSAELNLDLGAAAQRDDVRRVRQLLAQGLDPNETIAFGMTPLCLAVADDEGEHADTVAALLAGGANPNQTCGPAKRAPLHDAALDGDAATIRLLLAAGADVNVRNAFGRTPLFYADSPVAPLKPPRNASEVVTLLISFGAR